MCVKFGFGCRVFVRKVLETTFQESCDMNMESATTGLLEQKRGKTRNMKCTDLETRDVHVENPEWEKPQDSTNL